MKNPSTFIVFALSLAASAATAQTQPSQGLDPLLESATAPNKPSMACPAGNETGIVHVTAQKGEFFVDFGATPHRVRKTDSGWAPLDETTNPTVIAYNIVCPPAVMMKSAAGLTSASAAFSLSSFNSPSAEALGLGGTNHGLVVGTFFAPAGDNTIAAVKTGAGYAADKYLLTAPSGTTGGTPSGVSGPNLARMRDTMADSIGSNFASSLGANIGRAMGPGGFLGQDGAAAANGAAPHFGTAAAATAPVASADGAAVQNASAIPLTHLGTIRAAATIQQTENATFSSGAVSRSATPPDPNAGNPQPQGVTRQTAND